MRTYFAHTLPWPWRSRPASGSGAATADTAIAAAGPRTVGADARVLGDRALPPVAAQLEVGRKVAEGWDPHWLPGGAGLVSAMLAWAGCQSSLRCVAPCDALRREGQTNASARAATILTNELQIYAK